MAFGKSLYLLEALLPPESETVRYGHITGEVTDLPILLQFEDLQHVTVSNLVKLYPVNCFVLRLHAIGAESFPAFQGQSVFRRVEEESP